MPRSSRSIQVAPEHIQRVRMALRRHGFPSQNALAQELGIARATTSQFFLGRPVDYSYFVEISERLGLDWQAIAYIQEDSTIKVESAPPLEKPPEEKRENETLGINWRQVCREMLEAQNQRRLTTNPLTAGDGVAFELDEIYVPLGLVERKQRSRLAGDISPEEGSRIYDPEAQDEIVQIFQHDEFFEQVLRQKRSRRIAIIGEPGAGKTTLLQKIATWVLDNTEDTPIGISLADLQGKNIERYLLSNWLKAATRKVRVTDAMQDALGELFNSKQVWLLLDGVDEMVMGTQNYTPLQWIANQFTGWVADARVVLTCRLNLWDMGKNALEAFETYRNLDFSYGDAQTPDQVGQFIRCWFPGNPQLAERLRTQLNQPGKERIKDAVKNPLRLALLCRSWALGQGELPSTKAGLYQQFIEAVYEWKQDRFPTNSNQRQELNRALGELALRAISLERTKFRLRHRLVCSVLGEPDTALFRLALQLGWLNQVGIAAESENLGTSVYAFYHPTFQEYFAALAIDDWHYFLNHSFDNPEQGIYRIFESQWKEVILLWLGREDIAKEQKEEFIKALVEFEDGCKDFYRYRAYFLAAAGISEFGDCGRAWGIVEQIVKWSFGYFNVEKQEWRTFIEPIEDNARTTLTETQTRLTIAALAQLLSSTQDKSVRRQAAFSLAKIDPGNQEAIKVLVEILSSTQDESIRRQADFRLGQIDPGNQEAIKVLMEIISSTQDKSILSKTAFRLGQIDPGNQEAIKVLMEIISSTQDKSIRIKTASRLWKINPGNQEAIKVLVGLTFSGLDKSIRRQAAFELGQIDPSNQEAIKVLVELIFSTKNKIIRNETIFRLGKIGKGNQEAIKVALVELISSTKDESIRRQAAFELGQIDPGNQKGGKRTKNNLHELVLTLEDINPININLFQELNRVISSGTICAVSGIGKADPEMIRTLVQLIGSSEDESARRGAIQHLRYIGTDNIRDKILPQLIHLLDKSPEKEYKRRVSDSLAVAALVQLIESSEDEFARREATESLGKIGRGNPEAIAALMQLIKPTENEPTSLQEDKFIRRQAVYSLKKILRDDQLAGVVTDLKNYLSDEIYKNDTEQFEEYYKLIWHCAQIMSYPDFFLAWQNEPTLL